MRQAISRTLFREYLCETKFFIFSWDDKRSGANIGGYYGYVPKEKLPTLIQILRGEKAANNLPVKMIHKPGSQYDYLGGGYEVVQLLIESQGKNSFPNIVQQMILSPLKMTDSFYQQPLGQNIAKATDREGKTFTYNWRITPEYAAAGLWSDLATYMNPTLVCKLFFIFGNKICKTANVYSACRK